MLNIISHNSAIEFWRMSAFDPSNFECAKSWDIFQRNQNKKIETTKHLSLINKPIDKLCFNSEDRRSNKIQHDHLFSGKVIEKSFLKLNDETFICSPSFALMQVALQIDFIYLILLCQEFCGYFSYCNDLKNYHKNSRQKQNNEFGSGLEIENRPFSLCTKMQLLEMSQIYKGYNGAKNIEFACNFVCDEISNIELAKIICLLCLPHYFGGFGFEIDSINIQELKVYLIKYENFLEYLHEQIENESIDIIRKCVSKFMSKRVRFKGKDYLKNQDNLIIKLQNY